ncbi:MalM family protein [Agarivorans aestuarii]|uniref:MalM family protein n=1 Tax=Agarivorans aestuarii TaxID=1563703 RepID=UPI001C81282E|nr:MalM family protein [Agarivorans aestuarii]
MVKKMGVVLVASLLGISACSSGDIVDFSSDTRDLFVEPVQAIAILDKAPVCCSELSQLSYNSVSYDYIAEETVSSQNQAFEFTSGKSYVLAYKVAALNTDIPVKIETIIGETVFAPTVALLNENFEVNRVVPASAFKYQELKGFSVNKLAATFRINSEQRQGRERDAYMLVYTTEQSLEQSTQIVHPERSRAKAQAKADPNLPDPFIPHSPLGLVNVTFNPDLSKGFFADEAWFGGANNNDPSLATVEEAPGAEIAAGGTAVVAASSAQAVAAGPDNRKLKKAMLPETEAFYNKLIEDMIRQDEVEKALKLVEEAEYAGSRSARNTFIEAVKNK